MQLSVLKDFYLKVKDASGISPNTYTYYDKTTDMFLKHVGDLDSKALTFEHITDYLAYLRKIPTINSVSVQTYARGARCFVSWLAENDYCDAAVSVRFKLPKADKPVISVLTDEEQKRLLNSFDLGTEIGLRNFLICSLCLGSGLRRAEVCSILRENIFDGYMIVHGKGGKDRFVPLPSGVQELIRKYIDLTGKHEVLFLRTDGQPLTISTVKNLFQKLKAQTKIPRLGMHLLRHTFATAYYENGGSIYNLSRILGHSNLEITKVYMHLSTKALLKDFDTFTPYKF